MSEQDMIQTILLSVRGNFERDGKLDEVIIHRTPAGEIQSYKVPKELAPDIVLTGLAKLREVSSFLAHIESFDDSTTVTIYEGVTTTVWVADIEFSGLYPKLGEWQEQITVESLGETMNIPSCILN